MLDIYFWILKLFNPKIIIADYATVVAQRADFPIFQTTCSAMHSSFTNDVSDLKIGI